MKAVSHHCRLSNKTHQAANNGGKPGPEVPGQPENVRGVPEGHCDSVRP
jgi:hypothetical protein